MRSVVMRPPGEAEEDAWRALGTGSWTRGSVRFGDAHGPMVQGLEFELSAEEARRRGGTPIVIDPARCAGARVRLVAATAAEAR